MPSPKKGETEKEFVDRCIPIVIGDGAAEDGAQAAAICHSIWKEAKKEKGADMPKEYRTFNVDKLEVREEDKKQRIIGHAAVFNVIADGGGWFREQVAPGAFKKSIEKDDIRALFNHDPNFVLGRNKAGTLKLREDETGLLVEIDPPDTQVARDLAVSIGRGDITQMSFGFEILKEDRQSGKEEKEPDLFTLQEVRLWDVSPVTFPFYKETDVSVHSRKLWSETQRTVKAFEARGWKVRTRKLAAKEKHFQRRWR